MGMAEHNDDIWQVHEGDTVEIVTTTGECWESTCTERESYPAAEETGEVRETTLWCFECEEFGKAYVNITRGLRSRESDPEFPIHQSIWSEAEQRSLGYVDEITVLDEEQKYEVH